MSGLCHSETRLGLISYMFYIVEEDPLLYSDGHIVSSRKYSRLIKIFSDNFNIEAKMQQDKVDRSFTSKTRPERRRNFNLI